MMKCDALWEVGQGLHTSEKAIWLALVHTHTHTHLLMAIALCTCTCSSRVAVMIAHAGRQAGRCTLCVLYMCTGGIAAGRGPVLC